RLWLIDHGASLYFHHAWQEDYLARSRAPFTPIKDHVLLPHATALAETDARLSVLLPEERLAAIVAAIPDDSLSDPSPFDDLAPPPSLVCTRFQPPPRTLPACDADPVHSRRKLAALAPHHPQTPGGRWPKTQRRPPPLLPPPPLPACRHRA